MTERQAEELHTQAAEQRRRTEEVLLCESFTGLHGPVSGSGEYQTGCGSRTPFVSQGWRWSPLVVVYGGRGRYASGWGAAPTFDVDARRRLKVAPSSVLRELEGRIWPGDCSTARGASESCTDAGV